MSAIIKAILVLSIVQQLQKVQTQECQKVKTVEQLDLKQFGSKKWYIHQQMAVKYMPVAWNSCVTAEYQILEKKTFWGYDVQVHNTAYERAKDKMHDSGSFLCAKTSPVAGQLFVQPCWLPKIEGWTSGPYWVLEYDESQGYALIIGGQPTIRGVDGCKTGTGVNGAGLWLFTRQQQRDDQLVAKLRQLASQQGLDLTVLNDVDQTNCPTSSQSNLFQIL